jgi:hypothetical protein
MKEITSRTSTVFLVNFLSECSPEPVVMSNFYTKQGLQQVLILGNLFLGFLEPREYDLPFKASDPPPPPHTIIRGGGHEREISNAGR